MKKIVKGIIAVLLLISFVGCKAEINAKEVFKEALQKTDELKNVYYGIDGNFEIETMGMKIDADFDFEMWVKNVGDINNAEAMAHMSVNMFGTEIEYTMYVKDGKYYEDDGVTKKVSTEPTGAPVPMPTEIDYNELAEQVDTVFNLKAKKVGESTEITINFNKAVLAQLNKEFSDELGMGAEIEDMVIIFLIGKEGMIDSGTISFSMKMEDSTMAVTIKGDAEIKIEEIPSDYEIQYPDLSEFVEYAFSNNWDNGGIEYNRGITSDNLFYSEYLGVIMQLPSNYQFLTDKEMGETLGASAQDLGNNISSGPIYEFAALDDSESTMIAVITQEMPFGVASEALNYSIEGAKTSIKASMDAEVLEDLFVEVDGVIMSGFVYKMRTMGVDMYSYQYFFLRGDVLVSIVIGFTEAPNEAELEKILSSFGFE